MYTYSCRLWATKPSWRASSWRWEAESDPDGEEGVAPVKEARLDAAEAVISLNLLPEEEEDKEAEEIPEDAFFLNDDESPLFALDPFDDAEEGAPRRLLDPLPLDLVAFVVFEVRVSLYALAAASCFSHCAFPPVWLRYWLSRS